MRAPYNLDDDLLQHGADVGQSVVALLHFTLIAMYAAFVLNTHQVCPPWAETNEAARPRERNPRTLEDLERVNIFVGYNWVCFKRSAETESLRNDSEG